VASLFEMGSYRFDARHLAKHHHRSTRSWYLPWWTCLRFDDGNYQDANADTAALRLDSQPSAAW